MTPTEDYPKVPDLRNDSRVRDRLYYACTGWIGRNVFFRWKTGHAPTEFFERGRRLSDGAKSTVPLYKRQALLISSGYPVCGGSVAAGYGGNSIKKTKEAWTELTERWFRR